MKALRHVSTGQVYPVVGVDTEAKTITLKGEHGNFNEPYDVERFKQMGYERVTLPDEPEAEAAEG